MSRLLMMTYLITLFLTALSCSVPDDVPPVSNDYGVPGTVVSHIPKTEGKYVGSPSLCILPNGDYLASHDEFGPNANTGKSGITRIFKSVDKGSTWTEMTRLDGQYWSNLFLHNGVLYILGVKHGHGNIVIRKSIDGGQSWSIPSTSKTGVLFQGAYHTAPTPVVVWNGRIWRAFENADAINSKLPDRYGVLMISAPVDADLLNAANWSMTNCLPADGTWLAGKFRGWLEGNAMITKEGKLLNVARVHVWPGTKERLAMINVAADGSEIYFQPSFGFSIFPGGSKKFTIRYDGNTDRYITIANNIVDGLEEEYPANVRNTISLISSPNLIDWKIEHTLYHHDDVKNHGFQYVDWLIDGEDLIYLSRTAWDDAYGGADSAHNANYLTFHRLENYKKYIK